MTGYGDITTTVENSRNRLRRIARHDEQQFSKDSLVNIMEKFVKSVNIMDETILVPCRLMDRQVGDSTDAIPTKILAINKAHTKRDRITSVYEFLNSADLFNLYNMLNSLKNDLLWTRSDSDEGNADCEELLAHLSGTISTSTTSTSLAEQDQFGESVAAVEQHKLKSSCNNLLAPVKAHNRRPSTASVISSNSVSNLSDSESEVSNENDSGIESEGTYGVNKTNVSGDKATELARKCRMHLAGLYKCLEQMTEASNYLTERYQSDVGPV